MSGWVFEETFGPVRKADREVQKEKVYLNEGEQPPNGKEVFTGPRGGRYYNAEGGVDRPFGDDKEPIEYAGTMYTPDNITLTIQNEKNELVNIPFHIEDWNRETLMTALGVREFLSKKWASSSKVFDSAIRKLKKINFVSTIDTVSKYKVVEYPRGVINVQVRGFADLPEEADLVTYSVLFMMGSLEYDPEKSQKEDEFEFAEDWADEMMGENPSFVLKYERARALVEAMRNEGKISPIMAERVSDYCGTMYRYINMYLRGEKDEKLNNVSTMASIKMDINLIDEFIEKGPKVEAFVYRGMPLSSESEVDQWENLFRYAMTHEQEFSFPQFLSCTMTKSIAVDFLTRDVRQGVLFKIYSKNGVPVDGMGPRYEKEVLMARDTKFIIKYVLRTERGLEVVMHER